MRIATLVGITTLALGGTARAQDVSVDFDKSADFSKFRTYAWVTGTPVRDELNDKRITASVDARLAAKGLTRAASGGTADVLVTYHMKVDRALSVSGSTMGGGPYGWGGSRFGSARAEDVNVGTLVVDLLDPANRSVIWRGIATRDLDMKANADKRDKNVDKATEKMFKNYPPKTEGR